MTESLIAEERLRQILREEIPMPEAAPSNAPSPKITSVAVAGSLSALLIWALGQVGLSIPPEIAAEISVLIGAFVGWAVPNA